jgi:uncharacterized small protein (DUF1192 family)
MKFGEGRVMDEETKFNPTSHQTGMPLNGMSAEELEERLVLLFNEMQRIKSALDQVKPSTKKPHVDKINVFKSSFPRLSNPELEKK